MPYTHEDNGVYKEFGEKIMLKYLMLYEDRGLDIEYAEAQYVWDKDRRRYLDMYTGHGVAFLGHRHPRVVEALIDQINNITTLPTSFRIRVRDEMLEVLSKIIPKRYEYVYLLNSGSEAVDFALKICRRIMGRRKIIYFTGSFHGRTYGALSVTSNPKYREGFEPLLPETVQIKFNSIDDVDRYVDDATACVILELIQGEGGINIADEEFVRFVRKKTEEVGALMIIDEIQTGFGRTGSVWLFEQYSIEPDMFLAGKAIGGGFPVSAIFLPRDIGEKMEIGSHGSTYGGNPLACAAVKASTEVLVEEKVALQAGAKGRMLIDMLKNKLKDYRIVKEVRGRGLMIGVDLRLRPGEIIKCMQQNGVIALKAGNTIVRFLAPYMITNNDIEQSVEVLDKCINQELSSRHASGFTQDLQPPT
ncbi:MAG: aspartate aminotransferase family protein [Ignisphaera sp.]